MIEKKGRKKARRTPGRPPGKTHPETLNMKAPKGTLAAWRRAATREGLTVAEMVRRAVSQRIEATKGRGRVREVLVRLNTDAATEAEGHLAPSGTTLEAYLRELVGRWLRGKQTLPMKAVQVLDLLSNAGRRYGSGEYIAPARLEEIARRVFDAAKRYPKNFRAPNGEDFRRVVLPVENGRAAHALGHFIGAMALFGFAGEMLTLLLYKIHVGAAGFEAFERLGQEDRLDRIKAKIPDAWFQALSRVRARRRNALHFWSEPENPERESLNALADIGRVLGALFAHEVIGGRVAVKYGPFREYMNREWLPRQSK